MLLIVLANGMLIVHARAQFCVELFIDKLRNLGQLLLSVW